MPRSLLDQEHKKDISQKHAQMLSLTTMRFLYSLFPHCEKLDIDDRIAKFGDFGEYDKSIDNHRAYGLMERMVRHLKIS
jgi:hypothetical protein